jgi:hypothetical protein
MRPVTIVLVVGFAAVAFIYRFSFLWIYPAAVGVLILWCLAEAWKGHRGFQQKGYRVYGTTDDGFRYRERHEGGIRELTLPGVLVEPGHAVYCRLSAEEWINLAPEWARDRKQEIEARILEDPYHQPW